jgi:hypothetical protein
LEETRRSARAITGDFYAGIIVPRGRQISRIGGAEVAESLRSGLVRIRKTAIGVIKVELRGGEF